MLSKDEGEWDKEGWSKGWGEGWGEERWVEGVEGWAPGWTPGWSATQGRWTPNQLWADKWDRLVEVEALRAWLVWLVGVELVLAGGAVLAVLLLKRGGGRK